MSNIKVCRWCGRASTEPNPLTKHSMSSDATLPFRSERSKECRPCFNSINIQAAGDGSYREKLMNECATDVGRAAQRARTEVWEEKYNSSAAGRVTFADRGLKETSQVSQTSYMELEQIFGVVWPIKLAEDKLKRKLARKEVKTFMVGGVKIRGALLPEIPGEPLPAGCYRLKGGSSTQVSHIKEYDNDSQQLREGQVKDSAASLARQLLPTRVKQMVRGGGDGGGGGDDAGETPEVTQLFFQGNSSSILMEDDGDGEEEIDLLGGPLESVVRRHVKRTTEANGDDGEAKPPKKPKMSSASTGVPVVVTPSKRTGHQSGSSGSKAPRGNSSSAVTSSLNVLCAKAENMIDQITGKGLATTTVKALAAMVETMEQKLVALDVEVVRAAAGEDIKAEEVERVSVFHTKILDIVKKLRWAEPAVIAFGMKGKGTGSKITIALVSMLAKAGEADLKDYQIPETVTIMLAQRCWAEHLETEGWTDKCLTVILPETSTPEPGSDSLPMRLGGDANLVSVSKAGIQFLQEVSAVKSFIAFAKEPPTNIVFKTPDGRELLASARFRNFVIAAAAAEDQWLDLTFAEDLKSLRVAFAGLGIATEVEAARKHILEKSTRLSVKPLRNSSAIVEAIALLDGRILNLRLNQQVATVLHELNDKEYLDIEAIRGTDPEDFAPMRRVYEESVVLFRNSMRKAPPTFATEYKSLISDATSKVNSFFGATCKVAFEALALECTESLKEFTDILDACVSSASTDTLAFEKAAIPESKLGCKVVSTWAFGSVAVDASREPELLKIEATRIQDAAGIKQVFEVLAAFGSDTPESTKMLDWLRAPSLSGIDARAWFPEDVAKSSVDNTVASMSLFKEATAKFEKSLAQRWLIVKVGSSVASAFCAPVQAMSASSELLELSGKMSTWLAGLKAAIAESGAPQLEPADCEVVRRWVLDDDMLNRINITEIGIQGTMRSTVDLTVYLFCADLLEVLNLDFTELPAPKWEESITFDPTLKKLLDLKEILHDHEEATRGKTSGEVAGPRLQALAAWLAFSGLTYMRKRCDEINARLTSLRDLVNKGPLFDIMCKLDIQKLEDLSECDRKHVLAVATRSNEMKELVKGYNGFDAIVAWPAAIRKRLDGIHAGMGPTADILDATVRETAGDLKQRCEFVLAHCTCVQALLKNYPGNCAKQSAARRDACNIAMARASGWEVALKPSVASAVDAIVAGS